MSSPSFSTPRGEPTSEADIDIQISSNANALAAAIARRGPAMQDAVHQAVVRGGAVLETMVKANASGRPGPRVITGDYRRSITRQSTRTLGRSAVLVGTNRPQGRRLEYGFSGTDSLGRRYSQPPYAHFGPAAEQFRPLFIAAVRVALGATR